MAPDLIDSVKPAPRQSHNRWPVAEHCPLAGQAPKMAEESALRPSAGAGLSAPVFYATAMVASAVLSIFGSHFWGLVGLAGLVVWPALAVMHFEMSGATWAGWGARLRKARVSQNQSATDLFRSKQ